MKNWEELTDKEKMAVMSLIDSFDKMMTQLATEIFKAYVPIEKMLVELSSIVLLEKLAELEHDQWSEWMNHFFTRFQESNLSHENGEVYYNIKILSSEIVEWERKMNIKYIELLDHEKESDRKFARKVIELLKRFPRFE